MARKLKLALELELGSTLGELLRSSSNSQPQQPPAPTCCLREGGKFRGKEAAGAKPDALPGESEVCQTLRHRARVVAYPGLRLKMGRSFHN